MQQQYQPPYVQHQVMPAEYKMMPQTGGGAFAEAAYEPSMTFWQEPKCCGCFPKYTFNKTLLERELGDMVYKMEPTKNCFCLAYEAKIRSKGGDTLLTSSRPLCNCAMCGCCCLTKYRSKGDNIKGRQHWPCCLKNLCCHKGFYVDVQDEEKYWIGQDKRECCCGGEIMSVLDIWDKNKDLRLGSVYYIQRAGCCIQCAPICHILTFLRCLICEKHWVKIAFPRGASEAEKAMILASVSNGGGECQGCCIPYD